MTGKRIHNVTFLLLGVFVYLLLLFPTMVFDVRLEAWFGRTGRVILASRY